MQMLHSYIQVLNLNIFFLYSVIVASRCITTSYFSVAIEITHTPVSSVNVMTTPAVVSTIKLLTPTQAHAPLGVGVFASTVNTIQLAGFARCVRRGSTGRVPFWHIFRTIFNFSKVTKCCKLQHFCVLTSFAGAMQKRRKCCKYQYFLDPRCTKHRKYQCFWKPSKKTL